MKNQFFFYILIISSIPCISWAQKNTLNAKKAENVQTNTPVLNEKVDAQSKKVKYYRVEEIFDLNFGGHRTDYTVSDRKLIQTYDLGLNSKRIITIVYVDGEQLVETILKINGVQKIEYSDKDLINDETKETKTAQLATENKKKEILDFSKRARINGSTIKSNSLNKIDNPTEISITDSPKKINIPANIDIIKTYERVVEKGYETVDILKKLANSYFFSNQLETAGKYYEKLFDKNIDLEPEYYYRYSVCLKAAGKIEKSNEFFKKFNELSGNTFR